MKLIIFLILFSIFLPDYICAQNKKGILNNIDVHLIDKYIYELNRDIVIKDMPAKDTLSRRAINKAIKESKTYYESADIAYAPDRSFKIISARGFDCNTPDHCHCLNAERLYFTKTGRLFEMSGSFLQVDNIFKLDDKKYLALQTSYSCGGSTASIYKRASLLSVENGEITYHRIYYKNSVDHTDIDTDDDHGFSLAQDDTYEKNYPLTLRFNPVSKKLTYCYVMDLNICCKRNKKEIVAGYFEYKNGDFLQQEEHLRTIK
jgi:hypothetical protein